MESPRVRSSVPFQKLIVLLSYEVQMSSLECSSQNVLTLILCLVKKDKNV